jgi:glutamate formiminotransferase
VLLAWNVRCAGVDLEAARRVATAVRSSEGGLPGVRALAFELPSSGAIQVSMNLEDPERVPPIDVFRALERALEAEGGRVQETEVIGLVPDALVLSAACDRLRLEPQAAGRLLSRRLLEHMTGHAAIRSSASPPRGE